ncbi:MAG: hypothetical protein ACXVP0_00080 [Bacteroidia bacterium]
MQSPIYWHPKLYQTAIKCSFGSHYAARYSALKKHIPKNAQLLELCMGDAFFYLNHLSGMPLSYSCADVNPVFIRAAKRRGLNAFPLDLFRDPVPQSDYILIQGSLYHFIPDQLAMVQKLLKASNKQLIISEPVDNMSNSSSSFKAALAGCLSKARTGQSRIKFTAETLKESFAPLKDQVAVWEESPGNKEVIIVLNKI